MTNEETIVDLHVSRAVVARIKGGVCHDVVMHHGFEGVGRDVEGPGEFERRYRDEIIPMLLHRVFAEVVQWAAPAEVLANNLPAVDYRALKRACDAAVKEHAKELFE